MRKVVLLEHVSLDGFLAGPQGEMDWISVDDDIWEYVIPVTEAADTAIFGRVTYQMMESYWPTAADSPQATRHDIDHARWLNGATKLVFSKTLPAAPWGATGTATLVNDDSVEVMHTLKQQPGRDLVLIGSASLARTFIRLGLIDEYRLNLNPVVLGGGTPLFPDAADMRQLELVASRTFSSGVVGLQYAAR